MRSQSTSGKKPMMLVRIIKTPMKALKKAKDIYMKSISSFNTTYNRPRMIIEEANRTTMLSTDHSPRKSPRGLTRASTFCMAECDAIRKPDHRLQKCVSRKGMQRSCSVVMGRIDEDRVCSFREDIILFRKMVVVDTKKI